MVKYLQLKEGKLRKQPKTRVLVLQTVFKRRVKNSANQRRGFCCGKACVLKPEGPVFAKSNKRTNKNKNKKIHWTRHSVGCE